jgi:hypothetical protein
LQNNSHVFYRTIQDDLNLHDQTESLAWIHTDTNGKPYIFNAYTIPYLHPEGWYYLKALYYPTDTEHDAQVTYTVIEQKVEPFWVHKWNEERHLTTLLDTHTIGGFTIEKREINR